MVIKFIFKNIIFIRLIIIILKRINRFEKKSVEFFLNIIVFFSKLVTLAGLASAPKS